MTTRTDNPTDTFGSSVEIVDGHHCKTHRDALVAKLAREQRKAHGMDGWTLLATSMAAPLLEGFYGVTEGDLYDATDRTLRRLATDIDEFNRRR
jgi:hypothetical protein